jgi:hypothetical protein
MNAAQITTARTESRLPLIYTPTTVASFHYTTIIRTKTIPSKDITSHNAPGRRSSRNKRLPIPININNSKRMTPTSTLYTNNKVLNPLIPKLLPTYKVGDAEEAALPGAK